LAKYEIWGDDGNGKSAVLAFANGEIPQVGDTILVRGEVRDINKVWRHHEGVQCTNRIGVGPSPKASGEAAETPA
jgi:ABC-type molybdenum transport system ATPase subunit/photorepair protein PhrA